MTQLLLPGFGTLLHQASNDSEHCYWQRADGRSYFAGLREQSPEKWVFTRRWGSIHNRRGGRKEVACQSYDEGVKLLAAVARQRARKGYVVME